MSRTPRNLAVPLLAATVLLLAACGSSSGAAAGTGADQKDAAQSGGLPGEHVHGVARDPGDGTVYLATHEGLFRYDKGAPVRVGPVVDLMGFSVAGPGHFYASGHPGDGVDLPAPVGLMETTDAGKTWSVRSLGGESDFHALTSSSGGVLAYDGVLRSTADGKTWTKLAISAEPRSLAAAPDGSRVLATTASDVLLSSDQGATWADKTTATGVTTTGHLAVTTDAGATWTTGAARVDSAQAISASRADGGTLEVLLVTNSGVQRSVDSGASFSPLVTN